MMPFGEFITLGILEGFRSKFPAFSAQIQQLCSMITSKITNGLQSAKIAWSNAWMSMKDRAVSILSSIREAVRSAVDWISQKIKSIISMLSSIRSTASGLFSGNTSRGGISSRIASSYSAHPAIEKLNNMPIPGYATGQVIPRTMQKHLAILGDNNRETEVVSPLSTIRQALRDEAVALGLVGGNSSPEINLNLSVECEEYQLLHIMQKLDSEYYKQSGRHAFA